jgi:membrane protein
VPIFLVWLYVSWVVVLAGAVFTAMLPGFRLDPVHSQTPGRAFVEALAVLAALERAQHGGRVLALRHLARQARLLPYQCERLLERAADLGWVARGERDTWLLARDPGAITVGEVFRAFVYDAQAVGVPEADFGLSLREFSRRTPPE